MKKVKRPKKIEAKYICGVCGLTLSVDESSGSVDAAETVCCGKKMGKKYRWSLGRFCSSRP